MTTWIAGSEESTIAATGGGLPGRGSAAAAAPRYPAGTWHAVNQETGKSACHTSRFMEIWPDHLWAEDGVDDRCPDCMKAVPISS